MATSDRPALDAPTTRRFTVLVPGEPPRVFHGFDRHFSGRLDRVALVVCSGEPEVFALDAALPLERVLDSLAAYCALHGEPAELKGVYLRCAGDPAVFAAAFHRHSALQGGGHVV